MSSNANTTPQSRDKLLSADILLNTGLGALQILSAGIKDPAILGGIELAEEVGPLIEAAIANLLKVRGSAVTLSQLESLRFKPQW